MKRFLAVLLALTMVLGMSVMASAVGPSAVTNIEFQKKVNLLEDQKKPGEKFNFEISQDDNENKLPFDITVLKDNATGTVSVSVESILDTFGVPKDAGTDGKFKVGKYSFNVSELAGNTAGMDYNAEDKVLTIQVLNELDVNGKPTGNRLYYVILRDAVSKEKSNEFENDFKSKDLEVKKVLAGNMADPDDEFTVEVTLTAEEGKKLKGEAIEANFATIDTDEGTGVMTITFTIKGGETKTIENIPEDVEYVVQETDSKGYESLIEYNQDGTVTITNTKGTKIDTGISLDNLPYIMTMVLALGGLVLFVVRKRRFN